MNVVRYRVTRRGILFPQGYRLEKILFRSYGKKKRAKENSTQKALEHFDGLYKGIFRNSWPSIRLGLLSTSKYVALVNNYGNVENTEKELKCAGALEFRSLVKIDEDENELALNLGNVDEYEEILGENEEEEEEEEEKKKEEEREKEIFKFYPKRSFGDSQNFIQNCKLNENVIGDDIKEDNEITDSDASLSAALSKKEIDSYRFIDPSLGDSSLHEFIPVSKMKRQDDYIEEGDYYRFFKVNSDFPVNIKKENELVLPESLKVYSFPRGIISTFHKPKPCCNGVLDYYLLDGASILPVLALDLKPGDRVLDMCAAPGGKALTILQTMLPYYLVCNEDSINRRNRLNRVFQQYLYDYPDKWPNIFPVVQGEELYTKTYNKILVDVPCTTDRHSALVPDNNIFKSGRIKERLNLPEKQSEILEKALKMVDPGGTVVYSTCTLSPIQNDGVVNMALQRVYDQSRIEFTVSDLHEATRKLSPLYRFASNNVVKYGSLVLPFIPLNFGPMYFCKMVRNE